MKTLNKLKDIWSIKELRDRILFTLTLLAVFRLGTFVVLPGIDTVALAAKSNNQPSGLLGLINAFTGGAFDKMSIFALGIMPYISASIVVQLLGFAIPYFQKLQKEGESGTRKLNQYTRLLTVAITLAQSTAYLSFYMTSNQIQPQYNPTIFWPASMFMITAGTMFCVWLAERITDKGIGNGTSLLIMIGIVANLPLAFQAEIASRWKGQGGSLMLIIEMAIFLGVIAATIALVQAVRKIPLQFARSQVQRASRLAPGANDYLPVKLNSAGVMPIIFAQALMFIPGALGQWTQQSNGGSAGIWTPFLDYTSFAYNLLFFTMIVVFTYIYTALIVNPQQIAESLKNRNAFVPGLKPGGETAEFIDVVTTRITLPGAIALGIIAILPAFARMLGIDNTFAQFFGGTSLIIMVGVVLDTLAQVNNYLLNNKYEGLIQGELKGRNDSVGVSY
jgi:preprotein translocase subunit SecY